MKEKIVPFGEAHPVEVISVYEQVLALKATDNGEGYILLGFPYDKLPKKGDKGTIIFEKGGPKGGHWQYYSEIKS